MIFYILLLITFIMDYINLHQSGNHKDKVKYTVAMIIVAIVGIGHLKFSDNIQIAPKILNAIKFYGG